MCIQFEREDILSIYLNKPRDAALLSSAEQEMIISQADGHLKSAKGKAMLPQLSKKDIEKIFEVVISAFTFILIYYCCKLQKITFQSLPRDEYGRYSFHEAQKLIEDYRKERIARYKLMYPKLVKPHEKNKKGLTNEPVSSILLFPATD